MRCTWQGVSTRCVEDMIEALRDSKVSLFTIRELNKKAYVYIEDCAAARCRVRRHLYGICTATGGVEIEEFLETIVANMGILGSGRMDVWP